MAIVFKKVGYKNFLSTGNQFTEINLIKHPTTLISGKNGAGKSTLMDAICYALYGTPYRKVNKPNLVNSINLGNLVVELFFTVNNKNYLIIRGMKPNKFEIYENNKLIPQEAANNDYQKLLESQILRMNEKAFKQVIMIGSANYVPFMLLPSSVRRDVIEELLDIKIFSTMNNIIREKMSGLKEKLRDVEFSLEILEEKYNLEKKHLSDSKKEKKSQIDAILKDIEKEKDIISTLISEIEVLQTEKDSLTPKLEFVDKIENSLKNVQTLQIQLKTNKSNISKSLKVLKHNDVCPTCSQEISAEHKKHMCEKDEKILLDIDEQLDTVLDDINKKCMGLQKLRNIATRVNSIDKNIYEKNSQTISANKLIKTLSAQIESLSEAIAVDNQSESLAQTLSMVEDTKKSRNELIEERLYYDVASTMLKDSGIKSKIIKQYIPVMNQIINKYLDRFGLPIEFTLDEEFNEVIKSRYRDAFSYNNFSEGEKKRIDLAILFAWRDIARLKNSINCNLLILDETFDSSLDTMATEELLNLISSSNKDTNIFIVSHKNDISDKVRGHIEFEKVGNFSVMKTRPE